MKLSPKIAAITAAALMIASGSVLAQSSGNFSADIYTPQCTVSNVDGSFSNNGGGTLLTTTIQTSSGSGTTLLITPSLDTGLYTNTEVDPNSPSSSQTAAVAITVTVDGNPVAPESKNFPGVIYDKRFQDLAANFNTATSICPSTTNPMQPCDVQLVLSTLSAHSMNFVSPNMTQGSHTIVVKWQFQCYGNGGTPESCNSATFAANSAGACVGPGSVTVTQTKVFSTSSGITM